MSIQVDPTRNPTTFGLALAAGTGLIVIIIALGVGVVDPATDDTAIAVAIVGGLLLLIFGIIGWVFVVKPFTHFDDINEPKYTGHHGDHHEADEHAIVLHEDTAIIPHE